MAVKFLCKDAGIMDIHRVLIGNLKQEKKSFTVHAYAHTCTHCSKRTYENQEKLHICTISRHCFNYLSVVRDLMAKLIVIIFLTFHINYIKESHFPQCHTEAQKTSRISFQWEGGGGITYSSKILMPVGPVTSTLSGSAASLLLYTHTGTPCKIWLYKLYHKFSYSQTKFVT